MRFQETEKAKILPIFKRRKGKNNKLKQNKLLVEMIKIFVNIRKNLETRTKSETKCITRARN